MTAAAASRTRASPLRCPPSKIGCEAENVNRQVRDG